MVCNEYLLITSFMKKKKFQSDVLVWFCQSGMCIGLPDSEVDGPMQTELPQAKLMAPGDQLLAVFISRKGSYLGGTLGVEPHLAMSHQLFVVR